MGFSSQEGGLLNGNVTEMISVVSPHLRSHSKDRQTKTAVENANEREREGRRASERERDRETG